MFFRAALMAAALATPAIAVAKFQSGTRAWNGKPAPRGAALMKAAMLESHNAARRAYGSAPLAWNDALAASALVYARKLAAMRTMAHDKQVGVSPVQGENLFMGTRGAFTYAGMARLWVEERAYFKPGRFPDVVRSGHWTRVGHYTQIVWHATREVGCATASNAKDDYLVCRYLPAGNYFGTVMR